MTMIDLVFETLKEREDQYLTVKQLAEILPEMSDIQLKNKLKELTCSNKIQRGSNGWIYTKKAIKDRWCATSSAPITADEINSARKTVCIGMKMVAKNTRKLFQDGDEPDTVLVTVTSKHPYLIMTDKGISFTYAEVAKWLRNKRIPIGE